MKNLKVASCVEKYVTVTYIQSIYVHKTYASVYNTTKKVGINIQKSKLYTNNVKYLLKFCLPIFVMRYTFYGNS